MKNYIAVLLCAVFSLSVLVECKAVEKKKELTLGLHFESTTGVSSSQIYDLVNSCMNVVTKDFGFAIRLNKYSSDREVMQAFLDDEIDVAWLHPNEIMNVIERGGEVDPFGTYTIAKRRKAAECLWHNKNIDVKDINNLYGKRLLVDQSELYFIKLRELLFKNGIDKPLWDVFDVFITHPSSNSAFFAIAMGDADFYLKEDDFKEMLNLINPNLFTNLKYDFCSEHEYARYSLIINKKTTRNIDLEAYKKSLSDVLENLSEYAKKEVQLKAVKQYTQMIKMNLIQAEPDEYKAEIKLMKKAREKGWLREAEFMVEKISEGGVGNQFKIKPDYTVCKKWCADKPTPEARESCVNVCME